MLVQVGEAVTQGQPVYRNTSNNKYYQTDADVLDTAGGTAIVLTPASTDGYALVATDGTVNLGTTLSVGTPYFCSQNKGLICLWSDLASGDFVNYLGTATTAALLDLEPHNSGVAKA